MLRPSLLAALVFATVARAQDAPVMLDPIVVSATRTPLDAARTGSSISVITGAEIDRLPAPTIADALDWAPGIAFGRRGPTGASSEFSLRGFSQEDVVVRIDGIEIADPGEIRTQADLGQFLAWNVDRIEVLKGPQGALYGGEAVGGVIDITTRRGRMNGTSVTGFAEAGAYGTVRGGVGYAAGAEAWDFSLDAQAIRTDGFSAADEALGYSEADGYDNLSLSVGGSADIGVFTLGGSLRYLDRSTEIDAIAGGVPVDAEGFTAASRVLAGRAYLQFDLAAGRATNEVSVQYLDSTREFQEAVATRYDGERIKFEYLGTWDATSAVDLVYGGDWTREDVSTSEALDADSTIGGLFIQGILTTSDRLTFTAAARYDEHSEFGGLPTWRATGAFEAAPETVLRAAVGTGFRAPSNRELFTPPDPLFGPVGNPDLEPEEATGWEVGIDQALPVGGAEFSATIFQSDTDELIQFAFGGGYQQIPGTSRRSGVELSIAANLTPRLDLTAQYTHLDATDAEGERLEFVPRNDAGLSFDYRATDRLGLAIAGTFADGIRDSGEALDSYVVVDAAARYRLGEGAEAYLRVENLLDEQYQTVEGFGTSDRAFYAGIRTAY
jgi:vitamin B12 transporter